MGSPGERRFQRRAMFVGVQKRERGIVKSAHKQTFVEPSEIDAIGFG